MYNAPKGRTPAFLTPGTSRRGSDMHKAENPNFCIFPEQSQTQYETGKWNDGDGTSCYSEENIANRCTV